MKKTNNKGFSLVELIIVIAIMAILAGAIAPALIRYIDKSRKSNDVSSAKTIKTAVETAMGNESVYELLTTGDDYCYIYVKPGVPTAGADGDGAAAGGTTNNTAVTYEGHGITITGAYGGAELINGKEPSAIGEIACEEIGVNIGEKTPKLKFRKNAGDGDKDPVEFVAVVSKKGTVYVYISVMNAGTFQMPTVTTGEGENQVTELKSSDDAIGYQICPNICDEYQ